MGSMAASLAEESALGCYRCGLLTWKLKLNMSILALCNGLVVSHSFRKCIRLEKEWEEGIHHAVNTITHSVSTLDQLQDLVKPEGCICY